MTQPVTKIAGELGKTFSLRLWEDRTLGARWTPILYDSVSLKLVGDEYERTQNIRVTDTGIHSFTFMPLQIGTHAIAFELRYGWKFSAQKRLSYEVLVAGPIV